jgi:hypothetical protein
VGRSSPVPTDANAHKPSSFGQRLDLLEYWSLSWDHFVLAGKFDRKAVLLWLRYRKDPSLRAAQCIPGVGMQSLGCKGKAVEVVGLDLHRFPGRQYSEFPVVISEEMW